MTMIQYGLSRCGVTSCSPPGVYPGAVPDFVTSFHPNPLRNRTILLLFLGQDLLDYESLERRHGEKPSQAYGARWRRKGEELFRFSYGYIQAFKWWHTLGLKNAHWSLQHYVRTAP